MADLNRITAHAGGEFHLLDIVSEVIPPAGRGSWRSGIAHLVRLLGIDPPRLDGWGFGEATNAVVPLPK